eukprot:COSAG06_NODE_51585_length_311_cov_0.726415_1_plen_50_part_10
MKTQDRYLSGYEMHIDFFLQSDDSTRKRVHDRELAARCSVAHVERTPAAT